MIYRSDTARVAIRTLCPKFHQDAIERKTAKARLDFSVDANSEYTNFKGLNMPAKLRCKLRAKTNKPSARA